MADSTLEPVKRATLLLEIVGGAAAVWTMLYRYPPWPAVLLGLLLPVAGLVLMIRHPEIRFIRIRSVARRNPDPPPEAPSPPVLFISTFFLPATLAFKTLLYGHFESVPRILALCGVVWALLVGLCLQLLAVRRRPDGPKRWAGLAAAVVICAAVYVPTVVLNLNGLLDTSQPEVFHPVITGKEMHRGSKGASYYYVTLTGWNRMPEGYHTTVPHQVHNTVPEGSRVTVAYHRGRFGIPWFDFTVNGHRF